MSRLEDAVRIRNAAVKKLQEEGEFEEVKNHGTILIWRAHERKDEGIDMLMGALSRQLPKTPPKVIKGHL